MQLDMNEHEEIAKALKLRLSFAWAHLKLAGIALWPIGKEIVAADAATSFRSTAER
jgi:uncharacterized membrane protein YccF (DUF307 family)